MCGVIAIIVGSWEACLHVDVGKTIANQHRKWTRWHLITLRRCGYGCTFQCVVLIVVVLMYVIQCVSSGTLCMLWIVIQR